jgi:hypothetical protein
MLSTRKVYAWAFPPLIWAFKNDILAIKNKSLSNMFASKNSFAISIQTFWHLPQAN